MPYDTMTPVGCLSVIKLADGAWVVLTPDNDWTHVTETAAGYAGVNWAVDAVLTAEQAADHDAMEDAWGVLASA